MKNSILLIFTLFLFCISSGFAQTNPKKKVTNPNIGPQLPGKEPAGGNYKNCLGVQANKLTSTWKSGPFQTAYFDGMGAGICTMEPKASFHVNSNAIINFLNSSGIDGKLPKNQKGGLSLTANQDKNKGAQIVLYDNNDSGGNGRIDFNAGKRDGSGYGFVFSTWNASNYNYQMIIRNSGKVSIGDVKSVGGNYKLYVADGILTERVKVAINGSGKWSDFVFAEDYPLPTLENVETFIKENKHLPEIPSAEEMVEKGLDVAEMDAKLLQKIEELTLYLIEQDKQVKELISENKKLQEQFDNLKQSMISK